MRVLEEARERGPEPSAESAASVASSAGDQASAALAVSAEPTEPTRVDHPSFNNEPMRNRKVVFTTINASWPPVQPDEDPNMEHRGPPGKPSRHQHPRRRPHTYLEKGTGWKRYDRVDEEEGDGSQWYKK